MSTEDVQEPQGTETDQQDQPQGEPISTDQKPSQDVEKIKAESRKWEARAKADAKALADLKKQLTNVLTPEQAADKDRALADALAQAQAAQMTAIRFKVALAEGLPQDLAERLVGTSEDELREDASRLKALLKPTAPALDAKRGQGSQTPDAKPTANELLRRIAKG